MVFLKNEYDNGKNNGNIGNIYIDDVVNEKLLQYEISNSNKIIGNEGVKIVCVYIEIGFLREYLREKFGKKNKVVVINDYGVSKLIFIKEENDNYLDKEFES